MLNAEYLAKRVERQFLGQIRALKDAVRKRIVPAFDAVPHEADAVEEETWRAFQETAEDEGDPAAGAEEAREAGAEHLLLMAEVLQALLNATAVIGYHLFEQQLVVLLRREIGSIHDEDKDVKDPGPEFAKTMNEQGLDVSTLPGWKLLVDEMRRAANVIKHGNGAASRHLRDAKPELFSSPSVLDDARPPVVPRFIQFSAFGNDIYLTEDRLDAYFEAMEEFWLAFAAWLRTPDGRRRPGEAPDLDF